MVSFLIQIGLNTLMETMQVSLIASAFLLIYSVTRLVNAGIGAAFIFGAYGYYALLDWPLSLRLVGVTVLLLGLSVVNLKLLKPFIDKKLEIMGLLAGIAFWLASKELCSLLFGAQGQSLIAGVLPTVSLGPWTLPITGVLIIGLACVLALVGAVILLKTPLGRAVRGLKQHEALPAQLGIHASRLQLGAFTVALLVAGLTGLLYGLNLTVTPVAGDTLMVTALLAFFVGGLQDIRAVLLSAFILTFSASFFVAIPWGGAFIAESWKIVVVFVLALVLLLVRPRGLLSAATRNT